ncbi:hypothetical protein P0R31_10110 [Bradyrhizobium yuanmingense]|uniref:hypothetical protein n=1 Tax=Bradyrhizobium yuanmingense TaxID=108015 RepID=UPI0023B956C7|nr:hypothetical protein [Bradyrhizobium yuanmingense]MDF0517584.1 hypothetical protein [Bradyrhizobium yuanmingense]
MITKPMVAKSWPCGNHIAPDALKPIASRYALRGGAILSKDRNSFSAASLKSSILTISWAQLSSAIAHPVSFATKSAPFLTSSNG